jgi:hypothetical protein
MTSSLGDDLIRAGVATLDCSSHLCDAGGGRPIDHGVGAIEQEEQAMSIGPIQALVIGFPDNDSFEGRIAEELERLREVGQIRVIDAAFVMREGDDVVALSVSDLDDDERIELRAVVGALIALGVAGVDGAEAGAELGASADVDGPHASQMVAAGLLYDLPEGSSALVLAIEHLWAIPLRDAVRDAGGLVLGHRSITPENLIALGMRLGDEAELGQ